MSALNDWEATNVVVDGVPLGGRWRVFLGLAAALAVASDALTDAGPRRWPVDLRRPSYAPPTNRGPQASRRGSHKQNRRKAKR